MTSTPASPPNSSRTDICWENQAGARTTTTMTATLRTKLVSFKGLSGTCFDLQIVNDVPETMILYTWKDTSDTPVAIARATPSDPNVLNVSCADGGFRVDLSSTGCQAVQMMVNPICSAQGACAF